MPEEITEELKLKISERYNEMLKSEIIQDEAKKIGVSEATFHKYKNYQPTLKQGVENENKEDDTKEDNSFEDDFKPDENNDKDNERKSENKEIDDDENEDSILVFD